MRDASTLVSARFNSHGVPARAVEHALSVDQVAISEPVMTELLDVLYRPGIARFIKPERIISSDTDLLVLHPWRSVRILRPADYLGEAKHDA